MGPRRRNCAGGMNVRFPAPSGRSAIPELWLNNHNAMTPHAGRLWRVRAGDPAAPVSVLLALRDEGRGPPPSEGLPGVPGVPGVLGEGGPPFGAGLPVGGLGPSTAPD